MTHGPARARVEHVAHPLAGDREPSPCGTRRRQARFGELHPPARGSVVEGVRRILDADQHRSDAVMAQVAPGVDHDGVDTVDGEGNGGGAVHDVTLGDRIEVDARAVAEPAHRARLNAVGQGGARCGQVGEFCRVGQPVLGRGLQPPHAQRRDRRVERATADVVPPQARGQHLSQFRGAVVQVAPPPAHQFAGLVVDREHGVQPLELAHRCGVSGERGLRLPVDADLDIGAQHRRVDGNEGRHQPTTFGWAPP